MNSSRARPTPPSALSIPARIILSAALCSFCVWSVAVAQVIPPTDTPGGAIHVAYLPVKLQRVSVHFLDCADCASEAPAVSVWDESINAPLVPVVSGRIKNGFTLALAQGYYRVWARTASCNGDRFLGVLPQHERQFTLRVRCINRRTKHVLGYIRLVDEARGLAGTMPRSASAVSLWPADGNESPIAGTVDNGAYYFDEVNCSYCVLQFSLAGKESSRIGISLHGAGNFSLVRHDITGAALLNGIAVRGSPFNAPETLVEGPSRSIWVLDRLGNRVAVIAQEQPPHEIDLPSAFADAGEIIATSRFVWVSERRFDRIVRYSLDGSYKEYQVALTPGRFHGNLRMVSGGNDRIWFTDGPELGTLDEELESPKYFSPSPVFGIGALACASDGRVWVSGAASSYGLGKPFLATVTMDGHWQRFPVTDDVAEIKPARNGLWVTTGNYDNYLSFVTWQG